MYFVFGLKKDQCPNSDFEKRKGIFSLFKFIKYLYLQSAHFNEKGLKLFFCL